MSAPNPDWQWGSKEWQASAGMVWTDTYPPAFVRWRSPRGWMHCDVCGREFKLWVTAEHIWQRLPPRRWSHVLCRPCFRKLAKHQPERWRDA